MPEIVNANDVAKSATEAVLSLLDWIEYLQGVLALADIQLRLMHQTPEVRMIQAKIELALKGERI